jgi:O-methyltransferase involved in polyketide biosynthesis
MTIDTSKPNGARIYDFMLGGNHNFEADRLAAEQLLKLMPSSRNAMRLNRWFMHEAVDRLMAGGFTCFLDLASGLPTQGYVHELLPDAHVVYNDRDPVTVAYANQILAGNPNVRYFRFDLAQDTDVAALLEAADGFFGGQRRVAVGIVGVAYFLSDDQLRTLLGRLHTWCAPGSQVAMSWGIAKPEQERSTAVMEMYAKMGSALYLRSLETIQELLADWTILEPGLRPLEEWVEIGSWYEAGSNDETMVEVYGCIISR